MVPRKDFRLIAFKILNDTFVSRRWVKESIEDNMGDINEEHRDIAKIYELCYGILRNKSLIDFRLSKFIKKPVEDIKLLNILRIGYWQIKKMDSIPPYAAINTCVDLAKEFVHPKTGGFINAVLRNLLRDKSEDGISKKKPEDYLATTYSYEKWMVKFFLKHYPKEAEAIMQAGNIKPPFFIRVNTLKTNTEELVKTLKQNDIEAEPVKNFKSAMLVKSGNVIECEPFAKGLYYVQDLASQSLGTFIDAGPKDSVIDIGSAPGGKAAFMAMAMENKGGIAAIESDAGRARMIDNTTARLGITNVKVLTHDATLDIPALHDTADKVLVDAPCSALGVIRRHPEKKWCLEETELKDFPKTQLAILKTAAGWVKKGGELFYSTCTINPAENEGVAEKFLESVDGFKQVAVTENSKFSNFIKKKYFVSLPGNEMNMDGFFIARFMKK
ncbi:MAG TPA: 16S rRNA (cytosine(967)-C(5))-methyltransferase RsmB [Candidatus Goldiibacteriota bacterium]|mgnify:CR=1 FL=1|nr:16S rRNA (cytosine(967)-C(5))-methyltransferase RsmB [Candidatus Goldiibacteriota bacterium]HRQ44315.1 16S rRNA (cytosine(967)-C(5))-methyltransferase RsmB [Candidatus Goldiibacteriota bacterium]